MKWLLCLHPQEVGFYISAPLGQVAVSPTPRGRLLCLHPPEGGCYVSAPQRQVAVSPPPNRQVAVSPPPEEGFCISAPLPPIYVDVSPLNKRIEQSSSYLYFLGFLPNFQWFNNFIELYLLFQTISVTLCNVQGYSQRRKP